MRNLMFVVGVAVAAAVTFAVMFEDTPSDVEIDSDGNEIRHTITGDASEFSLREAGLSIKADWRGDFKLSDAGDAIEDVDEYLEVEFKEKDAEERVRIEKDGRKVAMKYWLNDKEQELTDENKKRKDELVLKFLRASGFEADERVELLLKKGGADAVLSEIEELSGSYAVRLYADALLKSNELPPEKLEKLLHKIDALSGDYDIARSLQAVVESQKLNDKAMQAILAAAKKIDGDYEKRQVLTAAAKKPLNGETADRALALLDTIDSDHDFRLSAEALINSAALSADQLTRLLALTGDQVTSDHDRRLILVLAAPRIAEGSVGGAWVEAFYGVSSDYDMRVALEAAAGPARNDVALISKLRTAAEAISSDYDRKRALKALK